MRAAPFPESLPPLAVEYIDCTFNGNVIVTFNRPVTVVGFPASWFDATTGQHVTGTLSVNTTAVVLNLLTTSGPGDPFHIVAADTSITDSDGNTCAPGVFILPAN